jgi:hypothetical protein
LALFGKGWYIWQIRRCEAGVASAIADEAVSAGLSHVLIKIADGTSAYNLDPITGADLVPPVIQALKSKGVQCWGWQYVYGYDPTGEADIAVQRIQQLGMDGFAIDAEDQYTLPGRDVAARTYMARLRAALPNFPIALSSYRYPTYHPQLPWVAFLEKCDYNMPQVYWVSAHNPGEQLIRSVREFEAITPFRPIIPTGSAYKQGDWAPTSPEIIEFLQTAQILNLTAANFWEWGHTKLYLPDLWDTVKAYPWEGVPPEKDIILRYFDALNAHNPDQVVALYNPDAVHVDSASTVQGASAIRKWYARFFKQQLPNGNFIQGDTSGETSSKRFQWTATSDAGDVRDGSDSVGIVNGKITYHYTFFSITPH